MEIKLNLASKPYLNRQSTRLWLLLACVVMVVPLALSSFSMYQNYTQLNLLESRFQELDEQASAVQGIPQGYTPENYAVVKNEIAQANEIVAADQFRWTALLSRFEEILPASVSIRTIQPDFTKHSVQLSCVAKDVSAMTQFVDNLLTSLDLNQAYLERHGEADPDQGVGSVSFSLVIREAF